MPTGNPDLAIRLVLAMTRLRRCLLSQRAAGEPSLAEDSALSCLYRDGPMTIGQLAAHEGVKPPTMTRVAASLEAHSLVIRHHDVLTEHERSTLSEAADILRTIVVKDPVEFPNRRIGG
jgi:DNA-binding MarR family transcriptional regulator